MTVTIPGYSDNNRVPGFYFALDNSAANTASAARRVIIVAQMLSTGSATANVAEISGGYSDAVAKYGLGSQCALMVKAYRDLDSSGELWVLPLADDIASKAASGTWAITGTATADGTLPLYVGDVLIPVGVSSGDTAATVAANVITAAKSVTTLPVSLTASNGTITATALNKGLAGNDILLGSCLLGTAGGQSVPAGLSVAITQMSGGTQNPTTLATALANLGERVYDLYAHPYVDTASLNAFKQLFDNTSGNWSPMRQLYGHHIAAYRGTYGQATAFGITQNDPHGTIMPISDSPSSPMIWAAQLMAVTAVSMRENPALPVRGLSLSVLPPTDAGRFTFDERASLLYDGLSTFTVADDNTVLTERLITTYQTNSAGVSDNSYLDIERLLTAEVCLQDMRSYLASTFNRFILVVDGSKIPAGAKATTAQLVGKAAAARYNWQCQQLWAQDPSTFSANLVSENAGNGVVKMLLPFKFADQLWVIAGDAQFVTS
ncbi:phage tail sheath subtilisin-like domain-containing protein [Acetobacter pasteurianus]|uniref:Mu-like prophage FluMu tail sheath protein n=1 Tax=Acetobacter pasteurianus subsp. pasteurianus TaxID=481145 RepID=A0A1Y0Y0N0_ACEPA|nr:phage tail sheath subtilisin-like domain-containing protein [Acetobacter pasteurianus]ARW48743.1 Mu-like prophage FluMu tail sheath protein [Acetobacter pasteurianus subsp. pasteurianus]